MHGTTPSVHGRNQLPLSSRASAAGQSWDLGTAGSREPSCRDRGHGLVASCGTEQSGANLHQVSESGPEPLQPWW